jgi:hypothetical protein
MEQKGRGDAKNGKDFLRKIKSNPSKIKRNRQENPPVLKHG